MADPLNDGISDLSIIQHMGSDEIVVRAARISYSKDMGKPYSEGGEGLIKYLLRNRHTSPLEHCMVTFHVACPLFVRSQWHRHRTWAYNEVSRRYTTDEIQFYHPRRWVNQDIKNKQGSSGLVAPEYQVDSDLALRRIVDSSVKEYQDILGKGIAKEQARMILPQNLYTRFYATASLHNIMHFVTLRSDPHAQYEIRVFSDAISEEMKKLFPISWAAYLEARDGAAQAV